MNFNTVNLRPWRLGPRRNRNLREGLGTSMRIEPTRIAPLAPAGYAWVVAVLALSGCTDSIEVAEDAIVLDARSGTAYELHIRAENGTQIELAWQVLGPNGTVSFDVHRHDGTDVAVLLEADGSEYEGTAHADRTGDFFVYWHDPSTTPLEFEFRVAGEFHVVGGAQG